MTQYTVYLIKLEHGYFCGFHPNGNIIYAAPLDAFKCLSLESANSIMFRYDLSGRIIKLESNLHE